MKTIYLIALSLLIATVSHAQTETVAAAETETTAEQKSREFYEVLRTIIDAAGNEFNDIKGQKLKGLVGAKHEATVIPPDALAAYVEKNIWPTYHATLYKNNKFRAAKRIFEDYANQMQCDLIEGWYIYESRTYQDKLMVYSVGTEANKMRGTEVTLTLRKNYDGIYVVELDVIKK